MPAVKKTGHKAPADLPPHWQKAVKAMWDLSSRIAYFAGKSPKQLQAYPTDEGESIEGKLLGLEREAYKGTRTLADVTLRRSIGVRLVAVRRMLEQPTVAAYSDLPRPKRVLDRFCALRHVLRSLNKRISPELRDLADQVAEYVDAPQEQPESTSAVGSDAGVGKRRRHRPKADEKETWLKRVEQYRAAKHQGTSLKQFCEESGIPVQGLQRALNMVQQRESRARRLKGKPGIGRSEDEAL